MPQVTELACKKPTNEQMFLEDHYDSTFDLVGSCGNVNSLRVF